MSLPLNPCERPWPRSRPMCRMSLQIATLRTPGKAVWLFIAVFKVGIAWQGNPRYPTDNSRSLPLRHFQPLTRIPGVTLFSLQKEGTDQLAGLGGRNFR